MAMNEKRGIFSTLTMGNVITICIVIAGIIGTYIRTSDHLKDEDLHVNDKTHKVLTIEEYKNLLRFANTVESYLEIIDKNTSSLIAIEKKDAVHFKEFEFLFQEHEGLEDKVSRINKELNDRINKLEK